MADLESLGRRAIACAGWRNNARLQHIPVHRPAALVGYRWQEAQYSAVPDFSDPLTVGWLLALVREKWAIPTLAPVCKEGVWMFWAGGLPHALYALRAAAEVELLVAALEVQNG